MDSTSLITRIRQALFVVRQQGQNSVSVDALLNYLSTIEAETQKHPDKEVQIAILNADNAHSVELLNAVNTYAQTAQKSAILINGSAAVALLAFIGNIWDSKHGQGSIGAVASAVTFFTYGVLASAMATGVGYLTQYYFYKKSAVAKTLRWVAISIIIGSYLLFALGVRDANKAFTERPPLKPIISCAPANQPPAAKKPPAQDRGKPLAR